MNKAKLMGIAPQLVVSDVVKSAEYYRDVLGFGIIGYFLEPAVYKMVERDGFQIHFAKSDTGNSHTNESIRKEGNDFVIWVPAIEYFFEEVKLNKAEIVQEIIQRSYGREFLLRDIEGHSILVVD